MIKIGIDPDLQASGFAVIDGDKIKSLSKLPFAELINTITDMAGNEDIVVFLEDPEANKPMFHRNVKPLVNLKIAQNVGQVKAVARLIYEVLIYEGVTCHKVKPLKGVVKKAKDDAKYFNKITGWEGRSNQDSRDAALVSLYAPNPLIK